MLTSTPSAMGSSFCHLDMLACEVPLVKIEQAHAAVMSRIVARNQRIHRLGLHTTHEETQDIDHELKQIMRSIPSAWWLIPSSDGPLTEQDIADRVADLFAQINQYHLLIVLHLPFVMQRTERGYSTELSGPKSRAWNTSYSTQILADSGRQVLSRFVAYRRLSDLPFCCNGADFKAAIASISLLLAHINGHLLERENGLEHQRGHDLAMVKSRD